MATTTTIAPSSTYTFDVSSPQSGHIATVAEPSSIETRHFAKYRLLPSSLLDKAVFERPVTRFDPQRHLNFRGPSKIHTFQDIGQEATGISQNAVCEPFSFLTDEAIRIIRSEMLDRKLLSKRFCPTSKTSGMVRGHTAQEAPFTHALWRSPEVLQIVSSMAGVELVPAFDYEVSQINISVNSDGSEEDIVGPGEKEDAETSEYCESPFGWHRDAYAFVCVTMLSDTTGMIGGETKIRSGNGTVIDCAGPQCGFATVLQGRYVDHRATAALGDAERITSVVSFRPKDPEIKDEGGLRNLRNISHVPLLYHQYADYRLENLSMRINNQRERMRSERDLGRTFENERVKSWLHEQMAFLNATLAELT